MYVKNLINQRMIDFNKTGYVSPMDESYRDGILRPVIDVGEIISVADNSGVKKVRISERLMPGVYLVKVIAVYPTYEKKIPLETELCGVLIRFSSFGYYANNQICLFERNNLTGSNESIVGKPMFTKIMGGTVAPPNNFAQYKTILHSCLLQPADYIRVDLLTYAQIQEINILNKELEGSEFVVKVTSGNRFFRQTGLRKNQLARGILRRRPFRTNVTTTSLLSYSFDVYELDIHPFKRISLRVKYSSI